MEKILQESLVESLEKFTKKNMDRYTFLTNTKSNYYKKLTSPVIILIGICKNRKENSKEVHYIEYVLNELSD